MTPLLASLLHTLWQAGIVWVFLNGLLRCLPSHRATLRYRLSIGSVALVVLAWFVTWALLTRPPEMPRAPSVLASVEVSTSASQSPSVAPVSATVPSFSPAFSFPWQEALLWVWQGGAAIGFLRIATSVRSARRTTSLAVPISDPLWLAELQAVIAAFGGGLSIRLRQSAEVVAPVVDGLFHHTILIPASLVTSVPREAIRAVLAHEIAHVIRWDYCINLLQMGAEALLFFNPFLWLLNHQARCEREACCDVIAARICGDAVGYAESLVWWSKAAGGGSSPLSMMAIDGGPKKVSWLRDRVMRLLQPGKTPRATGRWGGWLWAGTTAGGVLLLFILVGQGVVFTVRTAQERIAYIREQSAPFEIQRDANREKRLFTGIIQNEDGQPIDGASWKIMIMGPQDRGNDGKTGADGRFETEAPLNPIRFYLKAPGFAPSVELVGVATPSEGLVFTMQKGVRIEVHCKDESGAPLAGAEVHLSYYELYHESKSTADAAGVARFEHQPSHSNVEVRAVKAGYQMAATVVPVSGTAPVDLRLNKSAPYRLTVVDENDGSPVSGVSVRVNEIIPSSGLYEYPVWNNSLRTNEAGVALLEGLNPALTYGIEAEKREIGSRRAISFRITPGKETHSTLRFPRERWLKVRITNLPGDVLTVSYSQPSSSNSEYSRSVEFPVKDGVAEGTLRGLTPAYVNLSFLGQAIAQTMPLQDEVTTFSIDYATAKLPEKVKVTVKLDTGLDGGHPEGRLTGAWYLRVAAKARTPSGRIDAPLINGIATFEAPPKAEFHFFPDTISGARIDAEERYYVTDEPMTLTLRAAPAGVIRAKFIEPDGSLAKRISAQVLGGQEERVDMNIALGGGRLIQDWSISGPLEFRWSPYRVLAQDGMRYTLSSRIFMRKSAPVKDLVVTLPKPVEHLLLLVDERGNPVGDETVIVLAQAHGVHFSQRIATDGNGYGTIVTGEGNSYTDWRIWPTGGKFVPRQIPFRFGQKEPVVLTTGQRLFGRVVDKQTGKPVAGVRIEWMLPEGGASSDSFTTDETGQFDFNNAPEEKVFLRMSTPFPWRVPDGANLYHLPSPTEIIVQLERR